MASKPAGPLYCVVSAFPPPAWLLMAGPETTLQTQAAQLQPNRHRWMSHHKNWPKYTVVIKACGWCAAEQRQLFLRPGNSCAFMSANKPPLAYVHYASVLVWEERWNEGERRRLNWRRNQRDQTQLCSRCVQSSVSESSRTHCLSLTVASVQGREERCLPMVSAFTSTGAGTSQGSSFAGSSRAFSLSRNLFKAARS